MVGFFIYLFGFLIAAFCHNYNVFSGLKTKIHLDCITLPNSSQKEFSCSPVQVDISSNYVVCDCESKAQKKLYLFRWIWGWWCPSNCFITVNVKMKCSISLMFAVNLSGKTREQTHTSAFDGPTSNQRLHIILTISPTAWFIMKCNRRALCESSVFLSFIWWPRIDVVWFLRIVEVDFLQLGLN